MNQLPSLRVVLDKQQDTLTCLLSFGYERGRGYVVRKGNGTFLAAFKGRNARGRALSFFDQTLTELGLKG